jgi:hypothetical protein
MNHARTRRWAAAAVVTTLLTGVLSLVVMQPASANHPAGSNLEVSRDVQSRNSAGVISVEARLTNDDGTRVTAASVTAAVTVRYEIMTGPAVAVTGLTVGNDGGTADTPASPDGSCTIAIGTTSCTIDVTSAANGQSLIRTWIEEAGFPNYDSKEGRLTDPSTDCSQEILDLQAFRACQGGTATAGDNPEPDETDVYLAQWTTGATALDCGETALAPTGTAATVTCTATDAGGGLANQKIDAENQNGANDPDGPADGGSADYNDGCVTGDNGSCTFSIPAATDGGQRNNQPGAATICAWVDDDDDSLATGDNTSYAPASATTADGGGCSNNTTEPVSGDDGDRIDRFVVTWQDRAATTLDVNPENPLRTVGSTQTLTAVVKDQFGAAWSGELITFAFEAGSPNTASKSCMTAASTGACAVDVTSSTPGTDTICASFGAAPSATCNGETVSGGTDTARIDVVQITWFTPAAATTTTTTATTTTTTAPAGGGGGSGTAAQGYSLVGEDGSLYAFGSAKNVGDMKGKPLNAPIIGVAYTPGGNGYWLVAKDGGIFTFGDAAFFGSMGDKKLNSPVLGMAATPTGKGYWLFAGDGGIFTFGDAVFFGSMGDKKLNQPVINMEPLASGNGYWLVAADGGIFSFGKAEFFGSMGDKKINQPVFDMTSTDTDQGYWLIARDGGVFSFGDAGPKFYGNPVNESNPKPTKIIGMDSTPTSTGYWIADATGKVWNYGDASPLGDRYGANNPAPMIGFAAVPGLKP